MSLSRILTQLLLSISLVIFLGCSSGNDTSEPSDTTSETESTSSHSPDSSTPDTTKESDDSGRTDDSEEPFVLGDLVDPFDPPALTEIESQVTWNDSPIKDSYELLRERQSGETPMASVEDALELKNTDGEQNRKILSAMGRLPAATSDINLDATWNRHTAGDVKSTNPMMMSSSAEFDVAGLTSFGLFGFDWTFEPFASTDTVLSWHTSQNGLYDKVTMRDDLTWSDGTLITAHDVEFSYKVIMSSQVPVPAVRSGTEQLKYVKAYDDQTVVFFHKESLATNVWNINFPIIAKHVYENTISEDPTLEQSDAHAKLDADPVTGGPYVLVKRERGQEIELERRPSYYTFEGKEVRDKPHFKKIRFRIIEDPNTSLLALKRGDIEELQLTPEQWQTQTDNEDFYDNNTKVYDIEWVYFYFGWNCDTVFFEDRRVRQAMGYAFNHQEMLAEHRYNMDQPSTGIFHYTSRWAPEVSPEPLLQDLDRAESLLEEAGWTDSDSDGVLDKDINGKRVPFEFSILVSQRQDRIDICNLLRENLETIGIICNVRPMEFTVLQDRARKHQFQAAFAGWGTGTDPDTSENLWTTKAIDQGRNYVKYSNKEVDALFEEGKRELDPEKRRKIYQKIHLLLWDDQPYTWLFFRNAYFGFNKSLRGYNFSARGPYNYGPGEGAIFKPAVAF